MIVKTHRQSSFKLLTSRKGTIVPAITPKILMAAIIGVIAKLIHDGVLGNEKRDAGIFAFTPFTALGVAISLFLGFHNNASYGRWWEARTLWGTQIIVIRNLIRFLGGSLGPLPSSSKISTSLGGTSPLDLVGSDDFHENENENKNDPKSSPPLSCKKQVIDKEHVDEWRVHIIMLVMAQTHALRAQLRPICKSDNPTALVDRDRFLSEHDRKIVGQSRNPANAILHLVGTIIGKAHSDSHIDTFCMVQLSKIVDELCTIQTACERIHNTSLPLAYSLLVHRTAFLYVVLGPFAMVSFMGWWTPLFAAVIAYTFFGLDELARQIQEPFRDEPHCLALTAMCRTIEVDVCEALGMVVPPYMKAQPKTALLM